MQKERILISLENVSVEYDDKPILENICLDVVSNRVVTLIGPNGAGKSTLAKVILGLINPTCGVVHRDPKMNMGYVPQKFHIDKLMPISVSRFLNLYAKPSQDTYEKAINKSKVTKLLKHQLHHLSGGEMQRVLMAQALMREPDLLVLDEPSQGMDISAQSELYQLIKDIKSDYNVGVVLISHDLHFVMQGTDEVICLNKHVCCHGAPKDVRKTPEYAKAFGIKSEGMTMYIHEHDHVHHLDGGVSGDHE